MLNQKHAVILILSAVIATGANAMGPSGNSDDFGVAVANTSAERTIVIKPSTRHVHVVDGETVKFTVDGKEFTWHFSTWPGTNQFGLEKIAPQGALSNGVTVHVTGSAQSFGI